MKRLFTIVLACGLALSASAVAAAMLEDFEDGDISDWTINGTVTAAVDAGAAHDGVYGLSVDASGWMYRDDAQTHVAQGSIISFWTRTNSGSNQRNYCGFGSTAAGSYSAVLGQNTNEFLIQRNVAYGYANIASSPQVFLTDHWYRVEVTWGVGGNITAKLYDSNGTTLLNTAAAVDNTYTQGGIAARAFGGSAAPQDPNEAHDVGGRSFSAFDTIEDLSGPVSVEPSSWASMKTLYR